MQWKIHIRIYMNRLHGLSEDVYTVIVTFNGASWIGLALDSLGGSDASTQIIVVDNKSTDNTLEIIKREYPQVVLLPQSSNTGFGIGNNIGISYALAQGARFIFLLNQDAYVTSSAVRELTFFMEGHPEYAIATPLHCSPDFSSVDPTTQAVYLQKCAPNYISDACLGNIKPYYPIFGINAAAWFVRADAFRGAGGFDPIYFMYGEDDDLMERFNYLGYKFVLVPEVRIVHLRAKSPPVPMTWAQKVWRRSERIRAHFIVDVKKPARSSIGKLSRLLVNGFGVSTLRALITHDVLELASQWTATWRVLLRFRDIARRSEVCAKRGAHYLSTNQ